ncbi:MAG: hypothetical protein ACWA6R_05930 [Nitrosomonas sp.]
MIKITMLSSLALSLILYAVFLFTDEGAVLAFVLLGLLVSFTMAMVSLTEK